jgi:hypothetical protein
MPEYYHSIFLSLAKSGYAAVLPFSCTNPRSANGMPGLNCQRKHNEGSGISAVEAQTDIVRLPVGIVPVTNRTVYIHDCLLAPDTTFHSGKWHISV